MQSRASRWQAKSQRVNLACPTVDDHAIVGRTFSFKLSHFEAAKATDSRKNFKFAMHGLFAKLESDLKNSARRDGRRGPGHRLALPESGPLRAENPPHGGQCGR